MRCAVVLGGYGNFGRSVVAALAADRSDRVVVAGRDVQKARAVADEVGSHAEAASLDCRAANLAAELRRLGANVVVHAAGPFQGQDYVVARACIEAGAHYVDLADARAYVCGIDALDEAARRNDVLVVSGASSVPALSSAVVDMLRPQFSVIESIEHGITSGAKPPGLAAMEGVLGYVGKPFASMARRCVANCVRMAGPHAPQVSAAGRRALARQLRRAGPGAVSAALCAGANGRISRRRRHDGRHAFDVGSIVARARRTDELAAPARSHDFAALRLPSSASDRSAAPCT